MGDTININEIEVYLTKVKMAVSANHFRIERNRNRQANIALFKDYVINEAKSKEIILELTVHDFCEILQNEHKGFEHELLYVFGKEVRLLKRFEEKEEIVPLYIKFNKLENQFVIVVSFHKQEYPLLYAFK